MTLATTSACVGGRHVGFGGRTNPQSLPPKAKPQQTIWAQLTAAEVRALEALIQTGTSIAAASLLGLSKKTIFAHLSNARQKTGHRNTTLLLVAYLREQHKAGLA